jgi:chromosome segregation ATPase
MQPQKLLELEAEAAIEQRDTLVKDLVAQIQILEEENSGLSFKYEKQDNNCKDLSKNHSDKEIESKVLKGNLKTINSQLESVKSELKNANKSLRIKEKEIYNSNTKIENLAEWQTRVEPDETIESSLPWTSSENGTYLGSIMISTMLSWQKYTFIYQFINLFVKFHKKNINKLGLSCAKLKSS